MSQGKGTTPIDSGTEGFYGGIFHQVKQLQFYVNVCLLSFFLLRKASYFETLKVEEGFFFS